MKTVSKAKVTVLPAGKAKGYKSPTLKTAKGKAPKVAKVAKVAAKGKAPKVAKATRPRYADMAFKVLAKENPYRDGSKRAKSFIAATKSKTVADYVAKGGAMKYIGRWDAAGIISLS